MAKLEVTWEELRISLGKQVEIQHNTGVFERAEVVEARCDTAGRPFFCFLWRGKLQGDGNWANSLTLGERFSLVGYGRATKRPKDKKDRVILRFRNKEGSQIRVLGSRPFDPLDIPL